MIDVSAYLGHFAYRRLRHNTAPGLIRMMDRFGISRAVVSSASAITYRNPHSGNEELSAEVEAHRSRLIPFAVLSPAYAGWDHDLEVCHRQFRMRGVRLYPHWHNYKLNDPRCFDLVNAATARGMTISIPVRVEDRRQQGWLVDIADVEMNEIEPLIRACPKARFIVHNASGVAGSVLGRKDTGLPENFAVDIARMGVEFDNELARLIGIIGEDRVLFGTGLPFHYAGPALTKLDMLRVPETVKDKIRWRNAERWLNPEP